MKKISFFCVCEIEMFPDFNMEYLSALIKDWYLKTKILND